MEANIVPIINHFLLGVNPTASIDFQYSHDDIETIAGTETLVANWNHSPGGGDDSGSPPFWNIRSRLTCMNDVPKTVGVAPDQGRQIQFL